MGEASREIPQFESERITPPVVGEPLEWAGGARISFPAIEAISLTSERRPGRTWGLLDGEGEVVGGLGGRREEGGRTTAIIS